METVKDDYPFGARLLNNTESWFRRFVHFSTDSHYTITTLWVAGVHMADADSQIVHKAYARLGFVSNEPGSGKTTAMERALHLCPRGEMIIQPSMAGIMDAIDDRSTVALDEADKYFGKRGGAQTNVIGFINAGYRKGGGFVRFKNRKVDSFAPMLYSGLLEALGINPALHPLRTRSMLLEMHPAPRGTVVEEFDDERHDYAQELLRDSLSSWGKSVAPDVNRTSVTAPDGVHNRRWQLWRALMRVAVLAGGEWPEKALRACQELESGISMDEPIRTPDMRLMDDAHMVAGQSRIFTEQLIKRLHTIPDAPWRYLLGDPTSTGAARDLAAYMAAHGMSPEPVRIKVDGMTLQNRGYDLSKHTDCPLCGETRPAVPDEYDLDEDADDLWTDQSASVTDDPASVTDPSTSVTDPNKVTQSIPVVTFSPVTSRARPSAPVLPTFSD